MRIAVSAVTFVLFLATIAVFPIPVADRGNEDLRPIADAGPDLIVQENRLVSLNGSASKGSKGVVVFGTNTNVTDVMHDRYNLKSQFNPDVKVDDLGVIHVAWCGMKWDGYRHIYYSKSTDQGLTFSVPKALSGLLGWEPGCWERLDADRFGRVHVTWTNQMNSLHPIAYYSMSPDRGDTFNTPIPIDYGSGSFAGGVFSDSKGAVHITFSKYGNPGNWFHIRSEDNGSTFSDPVTINDVSGSVGGGARAVLGPNDTIHAVWNDDRDLNDRSYDIYYSVSFDGGSSFRMSKMVHDKDVVYQARPTLAVDENGNPYVVWIEYKGTTDELFYTVSYDGGISFEEKTLIVAAQQIRVPSMDIGDDGLPQVVWDEQGASYGYYNINYTKMDKIEKEFMRILSVNDDDGVFRKVQPSMDVDSNGTAHVVWVDEREQEVYGSDIYYAQSTLGRARIASYQWDRDSLRDSDGDGNSTNDTDATGPTPTFAYGDDGVFVVALKVIDELGETASDTAEVTVLNVNPTILSTSANLEELNASFMFRIAGEKWHNVEVFLFEDSIEVGCVNLTRHPGSPNNQIAALGDFSVDPSKSYSATAYYTPEDDPVNGQPWGATPAWLILSFGDYERVVHHTFNVIHNETWVWSVDDLNQYFPFVVSFEATAFDPGSDDLIFTWEWGDGISSFSTYYNDGIGPDPYPSPDINPLTVVDVQRHVFPIAGTYTIVLKVSDDDGGVVSATIVVS